MFLSARPALLEAKSWKKLDEDFFERQIALKDCIENYCISDCIRKLPFLMIWRRPKS